jgi:hypothetical protein
MGYPPKVVVVDNCLEEVDMGIHSDVYEFAARAGAFEGYVYQRGEFDPGSLLKWIDHLAKGYQSLPPEVRKEFQILCDGTIGRAIQSLLPAIDEDHEVIKKLKRLTVGRIPSSPDDFSRLR